MRIVQPTISILTIVAIIAASFVFQPEQAQAAWYDANWPTRVKVEINPAFVDSTLTNFPVYVALSDLPAGAVDSMISGCGDIRVTEADEVTETAREVVTCETTGDTGELYFLADSISSSATTTFYIYYGNSGATDYATTSTYGAQNVWSAYEGVWHMGTNTLVDSSGNAADSTTNTGTNSTDTKMEGSATDYSGSSQRSIIPGYAAISNDRVSSLYYWGWFEADAWSRQMEKSNQYFLIQFAGGGDSGPLIKPNNDVADSGSLSTGVYYQIGGRFTQTTGSDGVLDAIVNGAVNASNTGLPAIESVGNTNLYLGSDDTSTYMNGRIDEFRISAYQSNAWIAAEYDNMNTPDSFYFVGAEESGVSDEPTGNATVLLDGGKIIID